MSFFKPDSVRDFINRYLPNWSKGDWIDKSILGVGIKLPPFSFMLGDWVEGVVDFIYDGIDFVLNRAEEAWDTAVGVGFWIFDQGSKLWEWFCHIDDWFAEKVGPWVFGILGDVASWFIGAYDWLIKAAVDFSDWFLGIDDWFFSRWLDAWGVFTPLLAPVIDFFNEFGAELADFAADPPRYIWGKLKGFLEDVAEEVWDLAERILIKIW